jgi:hypothetical protein
MVTKQRLLQTTASLALCLCIQTASAQQVGRAPVDLAIPHPPAAITALGRGHLVYELHLTNFAQTPVTLDVLEVVAEGRVIATLTGQQLSQRTTVVGQPRPQLDGASRLTLAPGARAIAYMWVSLPPTADRPDSIAHRLTVTTPDGVPNTMTMAGTKLQDAVVPLAAPVAAGHWIAVRGPSNSSPHRLSVVAASGRATVPQRFAVDWVQLGDDGRMFRGEGADLTDWIGYGAPVIAAAAGTVVIVRDDREDSLPRSVTTPPVVEASDAPGNVIVIDIGEGRFVAYAHLKTGSARVKAGDRVTAGQVLGAIGNSGHSMAPHLHFQVTDAAEPLLGEGLPFALHDFTLAGRVPSVPALLSGAAWSSTPSQPARQVAMETPLENMVVGIGARP